MKNTDALIPIEKITSKICLMRDEKVLLDSDLAELYGVETKQLKRSVRRNFDRFPKDFMFQLSREEYDSLRSQFGTLKRGEHTKYLPYSIVNNIFVFYVKIFKTDFLHFPSSIKHLPLRFTALCIYRARCSHAFIST